MFEEDWEHKARATLYIQFRHRIGQPFLDYRDEHQAPSVMSYKAHASQFSTAKMEK